MNDWQYHPVAIVEADDFQDRYDRNGLEMLFYWKTKYPNFKISLFTIPDRTSTQLLRLIEPHRNWIELCMHGWNHESNFECYSWSYDKTMAFIDRVEKTGAYQKVFKAPGWTITHGFNGYPANEDSPIFKDPTGVYRALSERGYTIFDRHYNAQIRPKESKIVCVDCNPLIVHMHTWDMETGDKNSRNGFRQVEEEHGVPWDNKTEFFFVTQAIQNEFFEKCKYGEN